jgi:hypothetical protein
VYFANAERKRADSLFVLQLREVREKTAEGHSNVWVDV